MSKSNSSVTSKPSKPYPDFPLFPHATKRWAKKIRGKLHYFGPWDDPDGALALYLSQKDALHAGLTPADTRDGLTVYLLCGKFLTTKKAMLEAGELSIRTFEDYTQVTQHMIKALGRHRLVADISPLDFERMRSGMAKKWGPVRIGNQINKIRVVFNYGIKNGLIEKPIVFGEGFKRPSRKTLRKNKNEQGPKMFTAEEIRAILKGASVSLRPMLFLGINCGFGNADCGTLPLSALDLKNGWIDYPRPKTGIQRRCPLWPETVDAIKQWLAVRPKEAKKKDHDELIFLTWAGDSWAKDTPDNPISKETKKLLIKLGINGHRNFYCLRHGFQTIGDKSRDFPAVRHIMGHIGADIADEYREGIDDDRLQAVAEHVRQWLYAEPEADEPPDVVPFKRIS